METDPAREKKALVDDDDHDEDDGGELGASEKTALIQKTDEERGTWGNKCDFFLSALGYAVGLGNVWRFPKLAYDHGGGSFLIPYTIMLLFTGLPLFFMELSLGQFSGAGPTRLFGWIAPIMKGLGFGMLMVAFYVTIYYNVIIAWALYYLGAGFQSELPWTKCGELRTSCLDPRSNETNTCSLTETCISPAEDYFNNVVLSYEPGISGWENYGAPYGNLVICLFVAWIIVGGSLIKGVQSSGKVVYFTAIFPFVVLFILFVRGIMLPGAYEGIVYYVTPDFQKLKDVQVWKDAATQIFYSLGPGFGALITLASYNKFDNNCHRDAIIIAIANCSTSVFAGFVVFSILGFMSYSSGLPIDEVVQGGPALAFVVFPDAVANMALPQLWAFLFFLMLITLGLDSMFSMVETITTAVLDHFKMLREYKPWVVISTSVVGFILGLSMTCPGGIYLFTLIDATCASWNLLLLAFLEVTTVSWLYGVDRFFDDIEQMGMRLSGPIRMYWKACWLVITPTILIALTVWTFINVQQVGYADIIFPKYVQLIGWGIGASSVIFLPLLAIRQTLKRARGGKELGMALLRPTNKWVPSQSTLIPPMK